MNYYVVLPRKAPALCLSGSVLSRLGQSATLLLGRSGADSGSESNSDKEMLKENTKEARELSSWGKAVEREMIYQRRS